MPRRSNGGPKGKTRSFYLTHEAQDILDTWGDNASEFVNRSILAAQGLRRNRIIADIKMKTAKIMALDAELSILNAEVTTLQTQLSTIDKQDDISKAKADRAKERLKKAFEERAGNEYTFRGYLTGPAGLRLLEDAGFSTPDDCIDFLRKATR